MGVKSIRENDTGVRVGVTVPREPSRGSTLSALLGRKNGTSPPLNREVSTLPQFSDPDDGVGRGGSLILRRYFP